MVILNFVAMPRRSISTAFMFRQCQHLPFSHLRLLSDHIAPKLILRLTCKSWAPQIDTAPQIALECRTWCLPWLPHWYSNHRSSYMWSAPPLDINLSLWFDMHWYCWNNCQMIEEVIFWWPLAAWIVTGQFVCHHKMFWIASPDDSLMWQEEQLLYETVQMTDRHRRMYPHTTSGQSS